MRPARVGQHCTTVLCLYKWFALVFNLFRLQLFESGSYSVSSILLLFVVVFFSICLNSTIMCDRNSTGKSNEYPLNPTCGEHYLCLDCRASKPPRDTVA